MPGESRQRIGRYEIVGPLDAGGMGQVYRAWDPSLRREVALKILRDELTGDPARRHRLLEEARAAGGLNHPNILAVYDVGEEHDVAFIVTELIEGKNLRDEIVRGPLQIKRLLLNETRPCYLDTLGTSDVDCVAVASGGRATRNVSRNDPNRTRSPSFSGTRDVTRRSPTNVPFLLPRSSIHGSSSKLIRA